MDKKSSGNPYLVLTIILSFYLLSQVFQQYVLRLSSVSNPESEAQALAFSQHGLHIARLGLILLSMFLMMVAWIIISLHFYEVSRFWSLSALVFFLFFCLFEVFYRSLELFLVVSVWGPEIVVAQGERLEKLSGQYAMFENFVSAIYFPLLFSQFLGSLILIHLSRLSGVKLLMAAMTLNSIRLALRLSDYVGFPEVNIFSGPWYFPPVAVVFVLLIVWSYREYKKGH